VSPVPEVFDDEELLAALRQALAERQAVPPEFVEVAKNAFAWHNIDAELAELTYDSSRDAEPAPSTRAETASIRALTFTSAHLTIELEVTHDSLLGQIVPAQAGTIKVQLRDGAETTVPADRIGRFTIRPIPAGEFRLHCKTSADTDTLTNWLTL
jgi:hypothetical protein